MQNNYLTDYTISLTLFLLKVIVYMYIYTISNFYFSILSSIEIQ